MARTTKTDNPLYYNPDKEIKINTEQHAPQTAESFASQGFNKLESEVSNKGELFTDPASGYQEFHQRPEGYKEMIDKERHDKNLADAQAKAEEGYKKVAAEARAKDVASGRYTEEEIAKKYAGGYGAIEGDEQYTQVEDTNVITTDDADGYLTDTQESISEIEAAFAEQQKAADEMLANELSEIDASHRKQTERAKEEFTEQEASAKTMQFRLGQSGTEYAFDRQRKFAQAKRNYFDTLNADMNRAKSKLRSAYRQENYSQVRQLKNEIATIQQNADEFLANEKQRRIQNYQDLVEQENKQAEEERKMIELEMEEREKVAEMERESYDFAAKVAEDVAPSLISIDDNGEIVEATDEQIIKMAEIKGIDPTVLRSKIKLRADDLKKLSNAEKKLVDKPNVIGSASTGYYQYNALDNSWSNIIPPKRTGGGGGASSSGGQDTTKRTKDIAKLKEDLKQKKKTWAEAYDIAASRYSDLARPLTEQDYQEAQELGIQISEEDETLLDVLLNKNKYYGVS